MKKGVKSPNGKLNKGFIVQSNIKWITETNFRLRVTDNGKSFPSPLHLPLPARKKKKKCCETSLKCNFILLCICLCCCSESSLLPSHTSQGEVTTDIRQSHSCPANSPEWDWRFNCAVQCVLRTGSESSVWVISDVIWSGTSSFPGSVPSPVRKNIGHGRRETLRSEIGLSI